jgi:hypothetical protein
VILGGGEGGALPATVGPLFLLAQLVFDLSTYHFLLGTSSSDFDAFGIIWRPSSGTFDPSSFEGTSSCSVDGTGSLCRLLMVGSHRFLSHWH